VIALVALVLAGAPQLETMGSVDGPFFWADARGSVEVATFTAERPLYVPVIGTFASGPSVLAQGQLVGGWGLRVLKHRITLTASAAATGWLTSPQLQGDWGDDRPRFNVAPVLLSVAVPIPIDTVVVVPMLGATIPTRNSFGNDPVVSLQPQLRFRTTLGPLTLGVSGLLNLPVVTKWGLLDDEVHQDLRCPAAETRCRWPAMRELSLAALSIQGEYWIAEGLSAGLATRLQFRDENLGQLINSSGAPEGVATFGPLWSIVELRATAFGSWAFSKFAGVSASFGVSKGRWVAMPDGISRDVTGWDASISIWFRTDSRLSRFWLDR